MPMMQNLPLGFNTTPGMWEIKCFGLILIFVYAFFKFAWSYRLFNYVAILIGRDAAGLEARHAGGRSACGAHHADVCGAAARHFNRGQRAFFFALGYLGWFVSPWVFLVSTAAVVIVTWRRQFASNAWQAMAPDAEAKGYPAKSCGVKSRSSTFHSSYLSAGSIA